jgi:hypothetical protein
MRKNATLSEETLFPLPEAVPVEMDCWEDRLEQFLRVGKARGGLVPIVAAPGILGVSKARVYQLLEIDRLEKVSYFGQTFVTGRSVRDYLADDHKPTGQGRKKPGKWRSTVIGAKKRNSFEHVLAID